MKPFIVTKTIKETPDVTTVYFADKNGAHPSFKSGQYLTVYFDNLESSSGKAYSLSSLPSDESMSISVKAIGAYSNQICSLKPGNQIVVSKPYGSLYEYNSRPLVCIAGGIGISPIWSIIRSVLAINPEQPVKLLYSNRAKSGIVFHEPINNLVNRHQSFGATYYITGQDETTLGKDSVIGRIDIDKIIAELPIDAQFIVCGSTNFVRGIYSQLKASDIPDELISTETFFGI
jgi:ring-1,2-phenylacetyl-CoA epoxidase subunit PaaE